MNFRQNMWAISVSESGSEGEGERAQVNLGLEVHSQNKPSNIAKPHHIHLHTHTQQHIPQSSQLKRKFDEGTERTHTYFTDENANTHENID